MLRKLAKVWKLNNDPLGLYSFASPFARAAPLCVGEW